MQLRGSGYLGQRLNLCISKKQTKPATYDSIPTCLILHKIHLPNRSIESKWNYKRRKSMCKQQVQRSKKASGFCSSGKSSGTARCVKGRQVRVSKRQ
ncbi:hypothetical protein NPIL_382501 [Nephila pilipes]|uniref:Uncharacterized protein n=1 Tax=Nephila pilipes TaxID=299642 RepID=A0A8X6MZB7_NEPPI|nr:hypothetical protein NPIL_382501 [Nephila pilipes]